MMAQEWWECERCEEVREDDCTMPVRCECGGNWYRRHEDDGDVSDERRSADLGPPQAVADVTSERVALARRKGPDLHQRLVREKNMLNSQPGWRNAVAHFTHLGLMQASSGPPTTEEERNG